MKVHHWRKDSNFVEYQPNIRWVSKVRCVPYIICVPYTVRNTKINIGDLCSLHMLFYSIAQIAITLSNLNFLLPNHPQIDLQFGLILVVVRFNRLFCCYAKLLFELLYWLQSHTWLIFRDCFVFAILFRSVNFCLWWVIRNVRIFQIQKLCIR